MPILELELDLNEPKLMVDGYSLGDITLKGRFGSISSKDQEPSQSMMIFPSIVLLLDNIRAFLLDESAHKYRFVGIDTSFQFTVEKKPGAFVELSSRHTNLDLLPTTELVLNIWEGVVNFLDQSGSCITEDDPVYDDLNASVKSFKSTFNIP
jgi:hypothetical protein